MPTTNNIKAFVQYVNKMRELRQRVNINLEFITPARIEQLAATCKSEEFNEFISCFRFGGGGIISDNMRATQRKIIRFNHLLANMLIFHTVVYQTKGINKLRSQGIEIPNEILAGMSPYWTKHLNRFGMFQLDMEKAALEAKYFG